MPHITNWIFDLDNTLYQGDDLFFDQVDRRMTEFISQYLSLDPPDARRMQKQYLAEYGTSLSGLMAVHGMDPADFLEYVHDVDLSFLTPAPALRQKIDKLEGRKFIFTNGSRAHAKNVGQHLNIYDLFEGVFAIEDVDYIPKPRRSPYIKFCDFFDINPKRAIMFEDSVRNLEVPKYMGMKTVWVCPNKDTQAPPAPDWVDETTETLLDWLEDV